MKVLEIVTAEEAGFCFGVKRAVNMAVKAAKENENVFTLGPIIHNPQVVAKLKELGIVSVESVDDVSEGILIIRSHGIEPAVLKKARKKDLHIIDATCPFVKKAQEFAHELVSRDYQTFIFGDANHPEVKGILGATNNKAFIVDSIEDIKANKIRKKIGFVAQTTKSPGSYKKLICSVITDCKEAKIYNTICNTTEIRQKSAEKLAKNVDVMLIIGGYNSANTNRLADICENTGTPSYHIETADDLEWKWLKGKQKVGITAGASTPEWLIKEVIGVMSEENKELEETMEEVEEVNKKEEIAEVETEEKEEEVVQGADEPQEETEEVVQEADEPQDDVGDETEEEVEEQEEVEEEVDKTEEFQIADVKKGQTVTGTVVEINDDGIYVDVGYKTEGFVPLRELSHRKIEDAKEVVETDEEINVVVLTLEDEEGNMILSKRKADYEKAWEKIMAAYENDEIIEAEVTKEVKGGLVVDVGVRGFIPASHVAIGYVEDLSDYIGEELKLKVIEVERDKNNVVLSAKKVHEKEREKQKEETLKSLEEGQTIEGKVTKLVDFGAFVDLGGIEGLLHISEMSWGRIGHPSEILDEGQDLEVKVLGVSVEEERISLGLKQLLPDPWEEFARKHYEGEIINGKITKLVDFGAFMEVDEGIEGLIHISQLARRHVKTSDEVVSVGEEREAKIINIDPEQKRVGLSLKELQDKEQPQENKSESAGKSKNTENNQQESDNSSGATIGEIVGDIFEKDE